MEERDSAASRAASTVSNISRKTIAAALIVLIFFILIKLSFSFGRSLFYVEPAEAAPGTDAEITMEADDTADSIASLLKEKGIITNTLSFKVQATLYKTDFYPGNYVVNSSMTIKELLESIDERAEELEENAAMSAETSEAAAEVGYDGDAADTEDTESTEAGAGGYTGSEATKDSSVIELGGGAEGD